MNPILPPRSPGAGLRVLTLLTFLTGTAGCGLTHQMWSPDLRVLSEQYGAVTVPFEDKRMHFEGPRRFGDDEFAAAFAPLQRYGEINELDLNGRSVSDLSVSLLLQLKDLEWLNIAGTLITPAGIKRLHALGSLRTLWVEQSQFQAPVLADLRAALPGVNVLETDIVSLDRPRDAQ